jgi:hypothetical protein
MCFTIQVFTPNTGQSMSIGDDLQGKEGEINESRNQE